jgi:ketosteroid isomerase-like protein
VHGDKLALVKEVCALWSRGDLEATLALIASDACWEPSGTFIGSGQSYRGHDGIRRFWGIFREPWEAISLEPVEATELDDSRLLTRTRFRGTGRTSGVVTETELYVVWTTRDGLLTGYRSFADRALALEAAGVQSAP